MSRAGWKTANVPIEQARRIDRVVEAGYARSRDDFIRHWIEIGLVATGLLAPPGGDGDA